jgi:hypothetical protein
VIRNTWSCLVANEFWARSARRLRENLCSISLCTLFYYHITNVCRRVRWCKVSIVPTGLFFELCRECSVLIWLLNVLIISHFRIALSKRSSRSSSNTKFLSGFVVSKLLSKSRSSLAVSLVWLRLKATYALNCVKPPLGGVAMSIST